MLILAEFDNALVGTLDSHWQDAFRKVNEEVLVGVSSTFWNICWTIQDMHTEHCIPATSVSTVQVLVHKELPKIKGVVILEPGAMPLPGDLVLVPTLVSVGE